VAVLEVGSPRTNSGLAHCTRTKPIGQNKGKESRKSGPKRLFFIVGGGARPWALAANPKADGDWAWGWGVT